MLAERRCKWKEAFLQLIGCAEEENMAPFLNAPCFLQLTYHSIYCVSEWNIAHANKRLMLELRS